MTQKDRRDSCRKFHLIVAADLDSGIARNGRLPWTLPGDLSHFRNLTTGVRGRNAVIMGRKTWESIPERFRPLRDRLNVVLSQNLDLGLPVGVIRMGSLDEALSACQEVEQVFVIGGGMVYEQALNHSGLDRVYLTVVQGRFDCDAFLPELSELKVILRLEVPESEIGKDHTDPP